MPRNQTPPAYRNEPRCGEWVRISVRMSTHVCVCICTQMRSGGRSEVSRKVAKGEAGWSLFFKLSRVFSCGSTCMYTMHIPSHHGCNNVLVGELEERKFSDGAEGRAPQPQQFCLCWSGHVEPFEQAFFAVLSMYVVQRLVLVAIVCRHIPCAQGVPDGHSPLLADSRTPNKPGKVAWYVKISPQNFERQLPIVEEHRRSAAEVDQLSNEPSP